MPSVHIVGGGVAGFTLARELVNKGYSGSIKISDPEGLPYDRPPLSKSLQREHFVPLSWFEEHGVGLVQESVTELSVPTEPDDWVVLATGTTPNKLQVPGTEYARSLHSGEDAVFLSSMLEDGMFGQRVLIIGAGLVGAEFAATAKMLGAQVTLVSSSSAPLSKVLGTDMATALHAEHSRRGITSMTGAVTELGPTHAMVSGRRIDAEIIVAAIGVTAETTLAADMGLEINDGIVVDESLRTTSQRQVLAIGDAARMVQRPRAVHWEAAMEDAAIAAATIMGTEATAHSVPWFWSDRHDSHVETVGDFGKASRTISRLNRRGQLQVLFGLDESGSLIAASMVDGGLMSKAVKRLIARGVTPSIEELRDPLVGPRDLGRQDQT
ncbi:hydrocarbon reductase [Arthrobacter sp. MYb229]|uniref:NAD(P)/FAD-dependent oxidoreductase n=1 Tax=unclassified Arthrobacter TaxID=235627 RepID=UPI000CFD966D|nr:MULTISPECIES: FAD-dependent oxidoreductase [unclassified Arthrobacter]PRA04676.1 hydrocarbon reductase [Arthrobacter sp. MYb229]PRB51410.1 hydrocarbon reductase [Arthrobacter sp. MYb216]